MEQAFFSHIRSKIIPYLDQAKENVVIAMAWFTSAELFEALLSCLKRKVNVELILLDNSINYMYYAPDFNRLISAGGHLRIADLSVGFMHHKFCVIDNKIAITGSYNWTYYAETRNVENIIITDSLEIVNLFSTEFKRLANLLSVKSSCSRLSWDDIEARKDVDFRELNYEIKRICEVQNKPVRRFYETKTEVVRTEIKKTPIAKYSIGVKALDNNDNETCHSNEFEFFFDSKNEKEFHCKFIFVNPNGHGGQLIKEVDLMRITKGTCEVNLPIKLSMTLDYKGSLKIDVSCTKSGQRLTISALDPNFVKYVEYE